MALTAALFAPLFIDWSRHRGQIEAELSAVVGAPVVVAGPIDIRFLPTPYLLLKDVTIAAGPGGAGRLWCASRSQLEVALASLPSGRVRFTLARLDHPALTLSRRADGAVDPAATGALQVAGGRIALDRLVGRRRAPHADRRRPKAARRRRRSRRFGRLRSPDRSAARRASQAPNFGAAAINFASGAVADGALPLKLEATREGGPGLDLRRRGDIGPARRRGVAARLRSAPRRRRARSPAKDRTADAMARLGDAATATSTLRRPQNLVLRLRSGGARAGDARLGAPGWRQIAAAVGDVQRQAARFRRAAARQGRGFRAAGARLRRLWRGWSTPLQRGGGAPLAIDAAFTAADGDRRRADHQRRRFPRDRLGRRAADRHAGAQSARRRLAAAFAAGSNLARRRGSRARCRRRLGDIAQLRDWATRGEPEWASRAAR